MQDTGIWYLEDVTYKAKVPTLAVHAIEAIANLPVCYICNLSHEDCSCDHTKVVLDLRYSDGIN